MRGTIAVIGLMLGLIASGPVWSQADPAAYPARPVRIIVPYTAGGGTDTVARGLAQHLSEQWSQSVIVENRPGAATMIGAEAVAKATADGYTLLYGASPPQTISPHVQARVPFDPLKDHTPVSLVLNYANVLCVNKDPADPQRQRTDRLREGQPGPGHLRIGRHGRLQSSFG